MKPWPPSTIWKTSPTKSKTGPFVNARKVFTHGNPKYDMLVMRARSSAG